MKNVLLLGPSLKPNPRGYGGGTGGYTQNAIRYLTLLTSDRIHLSYVGLSVRGRSSSLINFGARFFCDLWRVIISFSFDPCDVIHILAQYRASTPREFAIVCLAILFRKKVVYDIKAGAFKDAYQSGSVLYKYMSRYILNHSNQVMAQGISTVTFLAECFNVKAHYFPNFISDADIPPLPNYIFQQPNSLNILFVGFQIREKGVFELLEACIIVSKYLSSLSIRLHLVGQESSDFKSYLDATRFPDNLHLKRYGKVDRNKVLELMCSSDIYLYPTCHPGEGHNNTINEAMAHGLLIITTRQGFMQEILLPEACLYVPPYDSSSIANAIIFAVGSPERSRDIAQTARSFLLKYFTSSSAKLRFEHIYASI